MKKLLFILFVFTACGKTIVEKVNTIEDVFKNDNDLPATILVYKMDSLIYNIKVNPKSETVIRHKSKGSTAPLLFVVDWDSLFIDFGDKKFTESRMSTTYKSFFESSSYAKSTKDKITINTYIIDSIHYNMAK